MMANCASCLESVVLSMGKNAGLRICLSTCKYSTRTYEDEIECDGYIAIEPELTNNQVKD
jgi:hypothetical protein